MMGMHYSNLSVNKYLFFNYFGFFDLIQLCKHKHFSYFINYYKSKICNYNKIIDFNVSKRS